MNNDKKCDIVIVGDGYVGKSALISKYKVNDFQEKYIVTVGIDYYEKEEEINNEKIKVKIWDTAGQERFQGLTKSFYKYGNGIILTYDVTNRESFNNLKKWIDSIMNFKKENATIIIVGNKIDLSRQVSKEDAVELARRNRYKYFETSAKTGKGVNECFLYLINKIINHQDDEDTIFLENDSSDMSKSNICMC